VLDARLANGYMTCTIIALYVTLGHNMCAECGDGFVQERFFGPRVCVHCLTYVEVSLTMELERGTSCVLRQHMPGLDAVCVCLLVASADLAKILSWVLTWGASCTAPLAQLRMILSTAGLGPPGVSVRGLWSRCI